MTSGVESALLSHVYHFRQKNVDFDELVFNLGLFPSCKFIPEQIEKKTIQLFELFESGSIDYESLLLRLETLDNIGWKICREHYRGHRAEKEEKLMPGVAS